MENKIALIDEETGRKIGELERGDRVIKKNSIKALLKKEQRRREELERGETVQKRYRRYATLNLDEIEALVLSRQLTHDEAGVLLSVSPFVGWHSRVILNKEMERATLRDLAEICGMSKNKTMEVFHQMVDKGYLAIIKRGREAMYCVNPCLLHQSTSVNATLFEIFGNYPEQSRGGKTWRELA